MPVGGARPGAGRPKGRTNSVSAEARKAGRSGEPIGQKRWKIIYDEQGNEKGRELITEEVYADFPTRVDAAKAAAPYYAPRLATQHVKLEQQANSSGVMLVPVMSREDWAKMAVAQQAKLKDDVKS